MLMHIFKSSFPRRHLYKIDEVEEYYRSNPFILTGYRGNLHWRDCLKSVFHIHNETLNIWTHLLGFLFFVGTAVTDVSTLARAWSSSMGDIFIIICILVSYQVTMVLSALFHTFHCHSKKVSEHCLSLDLLGISLGLLATYLSGIYYAFYCDAERRDFYLTTVAGIFAIASALQFWPKFSSDEFAGFRLTLFMLWAVYGVVPTIHWIAVNYQDDKDLVPIFLPRIIVMYVLCGFAVVFYVSKFPERIFPGVVDIIGHSHQWWHAFIFIALMFWRNTGIDFAAFRLRHGCSSVTDEDIQPLKLWPFH